MKKLWMVLGITVCMAFSAAVADDHWEEDEEHREHEEECCEEEEILERNVRLDFKLVPEEEGGRELFVIAATSWFETGVPMAGGGEAAFNIEGSLELLDDGRIFLEYEAFIESDDHEEEVHVSSGVILTSGKEQAVATLGDKTLIIKAAFVE